MNEWESVKRGGDAAITKWINDNLKNKSCLIVLIGSETANRKWVKYEIEKAWNESKGVLGVYIHNLNCMRNGRCVQGPNPFQSFTINKDGKSLAAVVKCYNPNANNAYSDIAANLENWIEEAIQIRNNY